MSHLYFSEGELQRLLALLERLKSSHPDRVVPLGASLEGVREFAVNGEPDLAMRDLADWLVDVQPTIVEGDREFIVEMAEAFPAENAVQSLREWQAR